MEGNSNLAYEQLVRRVREQRDRHMLHMTAPCAPAPLHGIKIAFDLMHKDVFDPEVGISYNKLSMSWYFFYNGECSPTTNGENPDRPTDTYWWASVCDWHAKALQRLKTECNGVHLANFNDSFKKQKRALRLAILDGWKEYQPMLPGHFTNDDDDAEIGDFVVTFPLSSLDSAEK